MLIRTWVAAILTWSVTLFYFDNLCQSENPKVFDQSSYQQYSTCYPEEWWPGIKILQDD